MAETQHNPDQAASRTAAILDTTAHRPAQSASTSTEMSEEKLKQYTCLYFGYGSNLSPRTMKQRCPDSLFISLARLKGWRWQINETGYANIVPAEPDDEVWGSLCFLSRRDEMALDESEGVPWLYEKKNLKVTRMPVPGVDGDWKDGQAEQEQEVEATAYVDVQRVSDGRIEKEYVVWVRKSVEDTKALGLPDGYAEKYIETYLPVRQEGDVPDQEIMMVRTMQFGEKGVETIPRGFASWTRG
jgi:gamma-glutamylcyclotransferase